jgi:hypothetical protein
VLVVRRFLQSWCDTGPSGGRLGDPFGDRPEVTLPKESSVASALPGPALALASRVPGPRVPGPAERLRALVPGPVALLLARVPGPGLARVPVPEQASVLALEPEPELRPSAALVLVRVPRPCAHT